MDYHLPAQVLSVDEKGITVMLLDNTDYCRRCAEGNGCGNHPWFQGIHKNKPLLLPLNMPEFRCHDQVELILSSHGINLTAFVSYAVPLVAFLLTLVASQRLHEISQLLLAVCACCMAVIASRPIQAHILNRHLSIQKMPQTPCPYPSLDK